MSIGASRSPLLSHLVVEIQRSENGGGSKKAAAQTWERVGKQVKHWTRAFLLSLTLEFEINHISLCLVRERNESCRELRAVGGKGNE